MMSISEQAHRIADLIRDAQVDVSAVYATIPSRVEGHSAVVSPAPLWGTFDGATFCGPLVSWEIILVSNLTDFTAAMEWFMAQVTTLAAVDELEVATWQQPERISIAGGDALAVRVQLAPRTLEG